MLFQRKRRVHLFFKCLNIGAVFAHLDTLVNEELCAVETLTVVVVDDLGCGLNPLLTRKLCSRDLIPEVVQVFFPIGEISRWGRRFRSVACVRWR